MMVVVVVGGGGGGGRLSPYVSRLGIKLFDIHFPAFPNHFSLNDNISQKNLESQTALTTSLLLYLRRRRDNLNSLLYDLKI